MKNQETNNKDNNQEKGCTFFFKNGTSQFVPGANLKEIINKLNNEGDSDWLAYGDNLLIRVDQIVEVIDNNPEEEDNDE